MGKKIYTSNSLDDTKKIAIEFAKQLKIGDKIIFNGDLGVGKTEFVKAICLAFGVTETITSPSFTIINQYECRLLNKDINIFHIDLYRITKQSELIDMGFQEIMHTPDSIFFIEWAENSFGSITKFNYKITIDANFINENVRTIKIENIN